MLARVTRVVVFLLMLKDCLVRAGAEKQNIFPAAVTSLEDKR
jgi:hypothetical protein